MLKGLLMVSLNAAAQENRSEIRVYNDYNLPMDPSLLVTMGEYNLALCLFRSLFSLDNSSRPHSEFLKSWVFDDKSNTYIFSINEKAKWSDGKPFTSADIIFSILRLHKVAPAHFSSLDSILDGTFTSNQRLHHTGLVPESEYILRVKVKSPTQDLALRLASVFIPMTREDLVDKNSHKIIRNDISLGPYLIDKEHTTADELRLKKNNEFIVKSETMSELVVMRKYPARNILAADIINQESWPNLILDRAFTNKNDWSKLRKSKVSIWTRPVDRILYLCPTRSGLKRRDLKSVVRTLGYVLQNNPIVYDEYPGMEFARSLQPPGFLLDEKIVYTPGTEALEGTNFKIAAISSQIPIDFFDRELKRRGLSANFLNFEISDIKQAQSRDDIDFILLSFGSADPDPVTWLSLVFSGKFDFIADYGGIYKKRFDESKKIVDRTNLVSELRRLLTDAGKEGLYLPLAHFSSIAVADSLLDLKNIRVTDETVDMSKIIIRK